MSTVKKRAAKAKTSAVRAPRPNPRERAPPLKGKVKKQLQTRMVARLLYVVGCVDIIATVSSSPLIVMFGEAMPLTVLSIVVSMLLFLIPQVFSSFLAERFAIRFGSILSLSLTLFATSVSTFLSVAALHYESCNLYYISRLLSGLFRHPTTIREVIDHQYPEISQYYDGKSTVPYVIAAAMVIGGVFGDTSLGIVAITGIMAVVEAFVATVVLIISFAVSDVPKIVPTVHKLSTLRGWLLRRPRDIAVLVFPLAALNCCVANVQLLYPSVDRRVFQLCYSAIGLHMSMDICLQVVIAPVILKWFSRGSRALVCFCAILLCVSMWVSPLIAKHGFRLYFVVTMFLTDIPAAVLQLAFSTFPTDTFSSTEKELAVKMQNYTKKVIKQWQPVFFMILQYQFPEHAGLTRVFGFPLALGIGIYGLTSRFVCQLPRLLLATLC
uniref:Uncharacterized protein TCIL3000_11_6590 n=1 Tax=Trypanosoma congolense (strain IL3000) TaxID=1068625 RepID=G0V0R2_TRYCI|nr:unnamed protein product [Trypanosoma congolense IL3000]